MNKSTEFKVSKSEKKAERSKSNFDVSDRTRKIDYKDTVKSDKNIVDLIKEMKGQEEEKSKKKKKRKHHHKKHKNNKDKKEKKF